MPRFRFEGVHSIPTLAQHIQTVARKASMCERRSILIELVSAGTCAFTTQTQHRYLHSQQCTAQVLLMSEMIVQAAPTMLDAFLQGIEQVEAPLAPTLGLTMMVKNEADFIVQTLNSTKPFIDHWTIVDTGVPLVVPEKSMLHSRRACLTVCVTMLQESDEGRLAMACPLCPSCFICSHHRVHGQHSGAH